MLAGEGLHPTSKGARVQFSGAGAHRDRRALRRDQGADRRASGSSRCKSKEEAIEWVKRAPFDGGAEIEIRQVFETEDFGAELTPELREQEERLRADATVGGAAVRATHRSRRRALARSTRSGGSSRPRLIAGLARIVRDVGLAEDLAQDALVAALEQWPRVGRPGQPGRLADGHGEAPRDRPAAPPHAARAQARGARPRARGRSRQRPWPDLDARARRRHRRRPAAPHLHRLPSGAVDARRGSR